MQVARSKQYRPATFSGKRWIPISWDTNATAIRKIGSLTRLSEPKYGPSLWNRIRGWLHI